nr:putative aspergillopepsin a-like aspartic endopeptidase [Quercus suber]
MCNCLWVKAHVWKCSSDYKLKRSRPPFSNTRLHRSYAIIMYSKFLLLGLAGLAVASPTSLDSYAYAEGEYEGLRIPMEKKALGTPLLKRVPGAIASNNKWWITFGVGTPPQDLNFLPDSGAAAFTVQSTLMPADETGDAPLYDPSKSSTANSKAWPGYTCEDFGFTGPVYNETITVGGQAFSNVALCVWTHAPQAEYGDRTGNLGMGPGGVFADPSIPIFMTQIASRIPKNVATYTFNPYIEQGELDIGFVDTAKYNGTLVWRTTLQRDYWFIQIDAVVDPSTNKAVPTSTVAAFRALLDHGGGGMTLRRDYLDWYFGQISGAVWDSGDNMYHYPCNANLPDMVFSTSFLPLHVPKWSWKGSPISTGSSTCKPDIQLVDPKTPDSVYFGTGFLEGVFCAFNYTDWTIGLANRPTYSTTVPSYSVAGSTKFCTGAGFTGTCTTASWKSNTCVSLSGTPFYHNTSSFSPSVGYCTLYGDTACASPFAYAAGVRAPGLSNTGGYAPMVGSYACFYPSDYTPRGSSNIQFCTGKGFSGTCSSVNWNSFECHNLDASVSKKFLSAGPSNGYCYLFTNQGCTGAIENGAPFVYPGRTDTEFGSKVPCAARCEDEKTLKTPRTRCWGYVSDSSMTLCFDTALRALRQHHITEREYLRVCLAHFAGERHPHERFGCARRLPAPDQSPVGEAIRSAALNDLYIPLLGTVLLERLFEQAAANDVLGLEETWEELRARRPTFRSVVQPLAVYAACKGCAEALRFCLSHGATLQDDNVHAALRARYCEPAEAAVVRSRM